jgi:hypothetical protein
MYIPTINDEHTYFNVHKNKYDNKFYPGNITEGLNNKHYGKDKNYTVNRFFKLFTCNYCYENYRTKNDLFRHLGYCDVDIRPIEEKNIKEKNIKIKQTKITQYFSGKYQKLEQERRYMEEGYIADNENNDNPIIEYKNNNIDDEIDSITMLIENLNKKNLKNNNKTKFGKLMKKKKTKNKDLTDLFKNIKI